LKYSFLKTVFYSNPSLENFRNRFDTALETNYSIAFFEKGKGRKESFFKSKEINGRWTR
jgi:hypothetical protein